MVKRSPAGDRGQAFTLEAFVAALVLLAGVLVALQSVAVTSNSASTTSSHLEVEQAALARGALDSAAASGDLRPTVLHWNDAAGRYHGAMAAGTYARGGPPTAFGARLNRTLGDDGLAYNVDVRYVAADGGLRTRPVVRMGHPSDASVRVARTVTLYDDDVLYDAAGRPTNTTLSNASTFYAPDADPGPVYNVVRVEVVAWRT